ncbi:MAG: hypothetical protein LIO90_03910 [Bacteroidales bacterium]|nr:hypothetical protein [Bacteroidales bacterium]
MRLHREYLLQIIILIACGILVGVSCNKSEYDELPGTLQRFVTEYFPSSDVATYTRTKTDGYVVGMRNGAILTFDADYKWIDLNGNGVPLPQQLIYDQMPDKLYDFLEGLEQTDGVYRVERNNSEYQVLLLDTTLTYDISTQSITYPSLQPVEW